MKADVRSHASDRWTAVEAEPTNGDISRPGEAAPTPGPGPATAKGESTFVELSRTQQLIARRMSASRATVPSFEVSGEVDMTAVFARRVALRAEATDRPVPSLNDFVIRACALALRQFPRFNGSYADGRLELHSRVNVGVAVSLTGSLVVPTVFDADVKGPAQIAAETRRMAERARAGELTPAELGGGTFTVSNLGMRGVGRFTAVINQPQLAILAVGAATMRPSVVAGEVVPRAQMDLTLACDHRIIYGADAADFLAHIRQLLEAPDVARRMRMRREHNRRGGTPKER